jgi:hypothetical protein
LKSTFSKATAALSSIAITQDTVMWQPWLPLPFAKFSQIYSLTSGNQFTNYLTYILLLSDIFPFNLMIVNKSVC